jgi:gliding motility-associated-like protein
MRVYFLLIILVNTLYFNVIKAQTYVFGQLTGSPNMITTGWNLTGNAHIGDTPGDLDNFSNELILTNIATTQSGGVFYNTPINLTQCQQWTVEFEYRIWGGNAADGLAFCFINVPPTGFVVGGGIGIPGTAQGMKVVIDTYDNCTQAGTNPELQIFNGIGYNECIATTPKVQNSGGSLNYLRNSSYQPVKIVYNNGLVTVYVNNVVLLTANYTIGFTGYMGFTASTGALYDMHSIRNVIIYTNQATSNAGVDVTTCSGENVNIGAAPSTGYVYNWSPATGLNSTTAANPTVNINNTTGAPITQTYTVTTSLATNPGLCATTDQIVVTIQPEYSLSSTITSCSGQYMFNGQALTQSGLYQDTLNTVHGCDSVVNLNLTIGTLPSVNAGQNITLCSNESGQIGQVAIAGFQYAWSPGTGLSATNISNPTVALPNLNTGWPIVQTYTLTVTDTVGSGSCSSTDQVDVTVLPAYQISVQDTLCNGGPFVYNGQTYTQTGIYIDSSQTINGCDSITTIDIYISQTPIFSVSDTLICIGESTTQIPNSTFNNIQYYWLPLGAVLPVSGTSFTITPSQTNTYYVTGIDPYLCNYTDTFTIQVVPLPNMQLLANDLVLCAYDTLELTASGANSYTWNGPVSFNAGAAQQQIINPLSGSYELIGTTQYGCQDSTSLLITVNPVPVLNLTPDQGICPGFSATISVSGATNYTWSDPNLTGTNNVLTPLQTSTYTVVGVNNFNCYDTASTTVTVYDQPIASFTADPLVLTSDNPTVNFTNTSQFAAINHWDFGDGTLQESTENDFSYTYPFVEDQNYTVILSVESAEGCLDQTQVLVQIKGGIIYYVPNTFTPDGDECNNVFKPIFTSGFDPASYHLLIFNRWGGLVFESKDLAYGWDGTMNYMKAAEGIYTYKIEFKSMNNDDIFTVNGSVQLMR